MAGKHKPRQGNVVSYRETKAIQAFLSYLHNNYSKQINPQDRLLIAAISAWFHQESGGLRSVIGNNPFNIRSSPLASGYRKSLRPHGGHFAIFSSMARGWQAAAYLLIHGNKAYGYRLALNALKRGGNEGANGFLAALAMSSWDAAHYGAHNWEDAYNPKKNHLLRNYLAITGIAPPPQTHVKPRKPVPTLPRDFNFRVSGREYLDPYAAADLYKRRHARVQIVADTSTRG